MLISSTNDSKRAHKETPKKGDFFQFRGDFFYNKIKYFTSSASLNLFTSFFLSFFFLSFSWANIQLDNEICHGSSVQSPAYHRRSLGSSFGWTMKGFVVGEVAVGQNSCEYLGFPTLVAFYQCSIIIHSPITDTLVISAKEHRTIAYNARRVDNFRPCNSVVLLCLIFWRRQYLWLDREDAQPRTMRHIPADPNPLWRPSSSSHPVDHICTYLNQFTYQNIIAVLAFIQ